MSYKIEFKLNVKKSFRVVTFICLGSALIACGSNKTKPNVVQKPSSQNGSYSFENDGQDHNAPYLYDTYTQDSMPQVEKIQQCDLDLAIQRQRNYLLKKSSRFSKTVGGLSFSRDEMLATLSAVESWSRNPRGAFPNLRAYKIAGKDNQGNVQFTGYFSPKMLVSRVRTSRYRYPIYSKPSLPKPMPSRDEIDFQGALDGMGLELAYADNLIDPFFMQIQGSGIVEFIDSGEQYTFGYSGSNGHEYYSIGRYLVEQGYMQVKDVSLQSIQQWLRDNPSHMREVLSLNPSYVFFHQTKKMPTGASGQPVTAYCSIAVDPKFIPYGSTVLMKRPVLNARGELLGHTNSVFFAQDKGGAIKGSGRVDIYMGIGDQAQREASSLKHYGALWLLLPYEWDK